MRTNDKKKPNLMLLIPLVLVILIPLVIYTFLIQKEEADPTVSTQEERITEVKEDTLSLIPDKYEVVESEYEEPSAENDGCVFLYTIYPKEYSDIEKEYLDTAGLIYCEDINSAVLRGQVDQVEYDQTEEKWMYQGDTPLETEMYGGNLVSTVALGGSHALFDYYIVRVDNSDELMILYIPASNRIRCDTYDEEGNEIWKEDCVEFRDSLPPVYTDWVPDEIYDNYYNDLLEILKDI